MRKRSRARVVRDVLDHLASKGSSTVTELSYVARMPYDRARGLVEELASRGLVNIAEESEARRVSITPKGLRALQDISRALKILEGLGLE